MSVEISTAQGAGPGELDGAARAVAAWVHQLGRTLKTSRLYDATNPTVSRFREELGAALARLLDQQGPLTLRFTDDDVLFGDLSLYPARSRDDNLALPFHRDGVRSLTFTPGIELRELGALLDAVLQVTSQASGQDDLVTLLWEAHLPHVDVDYVPADSDFGSADAAPGDQEVGVPWPASGEPEEAGDATEAPSAGREEARGTRSDDWSTGDTTVEIEAGLAELEALAPTEAERFRREFEAEHAVTATTTALAVLRAALGTGAAEPDRAELSQFTPRLLRLSFAAGSWLETREALDLLRAGKDETSQASLFQELLQPISIATAVEQLDRQETAEVLEFVEFAKELGDPGIELLGSVLAESQQRRNRKLVAEAMAEMCRDRPERLAPWLSDRRWFVVRNVIHILGWIGGEAIVGLLRGPLNHPEPRVRREAIAALGRVDIAVARPILVPLLERAETGAFCAALRHLSVERHPATARLLVGCLRDPRFEQRPAEERRAIYSSLALVGGEEIVPDLEAELLKGSWFAGGQEFHRQAVARCLARMDVPGARAVLQRGLLSKRGSLRRACEEALGPLGLRHG